MYVISPHLDVFTTIFTHNGPLFTKTPSCFAHLIGGDDEHFSFQKHRLGHETAVLKEEQEGSGGGNGASAEVVPPKELGS